jgi:signal transduction histidine kinase
LRELVSGQKRYFETFGRFEIGSTRTLSYSKKENREEVENQFGALYDLGQRLVLLRDPTQIAQAVLEIAAQVLDLQDSDFLLVDETLNELCVAARQGQLCCAEGLRLPLDGEKGITVAAIHQGQPLYVPDVRQDPRYVEIGFPAISEFAIPVQIEGRVLGVLNVESAEMDAFSEADRELLCILANQASLALENARLHTQEKRKIEELAILNRLNRRISASLDLEDTLDVIVASAVELIPCILAEVSLWDEGTGLLTLQALHSDPDRRYPMGRSFPPGEGYTGWMVRQKQPLFVPDVDAFTEIRPQLLPGELPFKAYAGVPLLAGDDLVGTLVLVSDRAGAFDPEDMRLLKSLANQAAVAIRNARLHQEALSAERLAAVGRVATSVAHDLRSPLGGIMRSAEFLARPELSPGTREKLSRAIVSLAQRLNNTTQQILDFVRKERLPLRCAPCPLAKFLEDVLTVLEVDFSDRGIEVVRDFGYRGELIMDSDRMAQVVYNIAANARDAMPQGGKFGVSTRKVKDRVEMRFSDTGAGVPKEVRQRIFEPFFSFGKRQGAGLGLAIAQRIVEEHGGSIGLESKDGGGAEFVVTLPL